jgi:hypothetical protein
VPFPAKVKSKVKVKINVKGVGQECPTHTGSAGSEADSSPGVPPDSE